MKQHPLVDNFGITAPQLLFTEFAAIPLKQKADSENHVFKVMLI